MDPLALVLLRIVFVGTKTDMSKVGKYCIVQPFSLKVSKRLKTRNATLKLKAYPLGSGVSTSCVSVAWMVLAESWVGDMGGWLATPRGSPLSGHGSAIRRADRRNRDRLPVRCPLRCPRVGQTRGLYGVVGSSGTRIRRDSAGYGPCEGRGTHPLPTRLRFEKTRWVQTSTSCALRPVTTRTSWLPAGRF